jgi:ribulose-phosphate 3-epimerase
MSAEEVISELRGAAPVVAPSLLACDFTNLQQEIRRLEAAGARLLHLDIMDGHFVPNLSFGLPVVEAIRRVTSLPLDVHLMISDPEQYVARFRDAGADLLTFHVEAVADPRPLLGEIRRLGAVAGLTLNPPTPLQAVEPYLHDCDLLLVMSVQAGFGGQEFEAAAIDRLRRIRRQGPAELLLSVDGGINRETIGPCAQAGADVFVAGSALFAYEDYCQAMTEFTGHARASRVRQVPLSRRERVGVRGPNSSQGSPLPPAPLPEGEGGLYNN